MAEYNVNSQYTLLERAAGTIDGKTMLPVVEVMDEPGIEDFFKDVPFKEANMGLINKTRVRTYRPTGTKRKVNQGVPSHTAQAEPKMDHLCLNEDKNKIDEAELDTIENPQEERDAQDRAFIAGMGQQLVYDFINADSAGSPEEMDGLLCRMNDPSLNNVEDCGGSDASNNCSILIVEWNIVNGAYGLYPPRWAAPRDMRLGIAVRDLQKRTQDPDNDGKEYEAYVTQFVQYYGMAVADELKTARIANINPTLAPGTAAGKFNENDIISLLNKGHFDRSRTRIYMNASMKTVVDIRAKDKANVHYGEGTAFGKPVDTIHQIPVRMLPDAVMLTTEAVIS